MKTCNRCKLSKGRYSFYKRKKSVDGLAATCKRCAIVYAKKYYRKHRISLLYKRKKYARSHLNKIFLQRKLYRTINNIKIKTKKREEYYKNKYGLSVKDKEELLKRQNNKCKICGNRIGMKTAKIDHDHKTGKIRALLCNPCNYRIIGTIESPVFTKAIEYLREYNSL